MKPHPANARRRSAARRHGSALLVVLVLLVIMTAMVVSNSVALSRLRQELRLLDRQQQAHFVSTPVSTNHVPSSLIRSYKEAAKK